MTFIKKIKTEKACKDFKPSFWDRSGCRLTHLCADAKNHWKETGRCVGIKPQELLSPKGLESGVSPTKSPKLETRLDQKEKNKTGDSWRKPLIEGGVKKGGHNPPPSRKKPSTPPPSQKAKKQTKPTIRDTIKKRR